ncbi:hypothetical protein D3C83_46900 [compost metagenome]
MRIVLEQRRQFRVAIPGADDRRLVDVERLAAERRHERTRLAQPDVALARLLGVVERIRVEEGPDELPRDVLEAELEVRVLVDRVVAGVERQRADQVALAVGHLRDGDDAR